MIYDEVLSYHIYNPNILEARLKDLDKQAPR